MINSECRRRRLASKRRRALISSPVVKPVSSRRDSFKWLVVTPRSRAYPRTDVDARNDLAGVIAEGTAASARLLEERIAAGSGSGAGAGKGKGVADARSRAQPGGIVPDWARAPTGNLGARGTGAGGGVAHG